VLWIWGLVWAPIWVAIWCQIPAQMKRQPNRSHRPKRAPAMAPEKNESTHGRAPAAGRTVPAREDVDVRAATRVSTVRAPFPSLMGIPPRRDQSGLLPSLAVLELSC